MSNTTVAWKFDEGRQKWYEKSSAKMEVIKKHYQQTLMDLTFTT